jgi:glutamate dehydrogenase/leucine dehydrogenase
VVADMITGYGVAESVKHYYNIYGGELKGKRVIIQGWGNVGSAGAYYLAQEGAVIVGIVDRVGGLIKEEGFSLEEVRTLFLEKDGNALSAPDMLSFGEVNNKIWDLKAEVFLPCAASRLITKDQVDRMISAGMEVIAAGANVPFADPEIFFGAIADYTDNNISVIPDFISNCGMARVFAYLMSTDLDKIEDDLIFIDTSNTIKKALENAHNINNGKTQIAKTAFEVALNQLI